MITMPEPPAPPELLVCPVTPPPPEPELANPLVGKDSVEDYKQSVNVDNLRQNDKDKDNDLLRHRDKPET